MIGERISQYEILEELGRGGMGVVYKARDTKLDRFVALKFLPPLLTQDQEARDRFVREAKAAAAIEHNHICTIHDIAETEDGRTYIVMSYYSGQALNERIAEGPIPVMDAIRYGAQAASALAAAHKSGIAHRDIKPGNLILTDADEIKLVDFGLAKLAGQVDLTKTSRTVGTAAYMSPEQVKGETVDHRTDLWSLGVVLYEMVEGERPFKGEYEQALSYAIVNVDPPALETANPQLEGLDKLLQNQLLVKDPEQRSSSATEISAQMQSLLQGSGVTNTDVSHQKSADAWNRAWTRTTILAPVAVVVMALLFGYWYINRDEAPVAGALPVEPGVTRIAVLPFSLSGSQGNVRLGDGMVDLLSTKIDGAGSWHSVDPRLIISTASARDGSAIDPASAARLADDLSASLFVLGNIVEVGGRLRVDAAIYETGGSLEPIGTGTVEGNADDLFELVDGLAAQLLINPDDASSERLSDLAKLTTSSVDALKAYLEGEALFRAFNFVESATSLQRAVEIDSTFALAWYRLSVVTDWITWSGLSVEAAKNAVQFGQDVSERDQMLFDAMWASRSGNLELSERLYNAILLRDPDDSEALFNLAELLFHDAPTWGRSYVLAENMWKRVLELEPSSISSLVHLARLAIYMEDFDRAGGLVDQVLDGLPDGDRNPEFLGLKYIVTRDTTYRDEMVSALSETDLSTLVTSAFALWGAELPVGALLQVIDLVADESRGPEANALAYAWKSMVYLAHGRLSDARSAIAQIAELDKDLHLAYELFFALHPFSLTSDADLRTLLERYQNWNPETAKISTNPLVMLSAYNDLYHIIRAFGMGRIAIRLGDLQMANDMIEVLERLGENITHSSTIGSELAASIRARTFPANSLERLAELERAVPQAWFQFRIASPIYAMPEDRYRRALTLQYLGRHEEALVQFETLRRVTAPDYEYYVPSLVAKVRSLIALGQDGRAKDLLNRFLDMWKDADPELEFLKTEARDLLQDLE